MQQLTIRIKSGQPQKRFSEAFKKEVVRDYEQGLLNKDQIQIKYGLGGNSTVLKWCRKYGKFDYTKRKPTGRLMKDPHQRIKELEAKLKKSELKVKVYEKLIEVTNRELDTDIIKKIEAKLSENWQQKKD
jgi:transposase-like protein